MQIYLVGGAVRDQLLGLLVKDRDWLVVGATPEQLRQQGYQQVGKDFPVFLHPETKEEYALARTERKKGKGYTGFICDFEPTITLEQDLTRRDLTINAIAQGSGGELYDPYGGIDDLEHRVLRHISPAFTEDPLRVLRVARFAARYHYLGFKIAPETQNLMAKLTMSGELEHLTPERVWAETEQALLTPNPEIYFEVLRQIGALAILFPELDQLYGIPQPEKYHPEIDTFIHTMLVLQQATKLTTQSEENPLAIRFAALCHDLGKGKTDVALLPHHYGHEKAGVPLVRALCKRVKIPTYLKDLAELVCQYHTHCHKAFELRPETVITLFNVFDAWRKPKRFAEFLLVCQADHQGRLGSENGDYPQRRYLQQLYQVAQSVDVAQIIADGFEKEGIRDELNKRRIQKIKEYKNFHKMRLSILNVSYACGLEEAKNPVKDFE